MTVQELIDELEAIEDKSQKVVTWDAYAYCNDLGSLEESQGCVELSFD